ncbi:MAG: PDZ domain-containing protein, partial [Candidatus Nitrosopolaris sp.]
FTSDLAENASLPVNLEGVFVNTITKNGPADKVGVHGSTTDQYGKKHLGDIIIAADGHNITKANDLVNYIGQHKSVGDNLTLTVYRNGHAIDLKTTLTARPSLFPFLTMRSAPPSSIPHFPTPFIPHP